MLKRFLAFALLAGAALFVIAGCEDTPEQNRSVVTVASLNCNAPTYADMLTDSMSIAETWVPTVFQNKPYDQNIVTEPGAPYGDFIVTEYTIAWESVNGGPVLPTRTEYTSFSIPSGEAVIASFRLVSLQDKLDATLIGSLPTTIRANIVFTGHEAGNERDIEVRTSTMVSFANFSPDPAPPTCQ